MKNITYKEFIQNIIDTRGQWNIPEGEYWEGHHIIPKCLGGDGKSDSYHINIIRLYPQEHYEAHRLLALENPFNESILRAWFAVSHWTHTTNRYIKINADEYAKLRKIIAKATSNRFIGHIPWNKGKTGVYSEETKKAMGWRIGIPPSNKGQHHSEEARAKIRAARARQVIQPPTKEHRQKISNTLKEWYKNNRIVKSNYIQIIDINSGFIYKSKLDCTKKTGIGRKMLVKCLKYNLNWHNYLFKIYKKGE